MKKFTTENTWEDVWGADGWGSETSDAFGLDQIVRKYLPQGEGQKTFVELGCAPGSNMAYFHNAMGYEVTGVDYAGIELTSAYLAGQKIPYRLIDCDIFEWEPEESFDVVFSTGLVEHFDPIAPIVDLHKKFVSENGFVVIAIPNLRYFNKLMVKIVKPELLEIHNMRIMSPKAFKRHFSGNGFICHYCNYYKTSLLDLDSNYDYLRERKKLDMLYKALRKISSGLKLGNIPNRFFSPNIVIIAQRASESKCE
ncbi:MAG: class I SAM-dependent methyltransferase [Clostridiales Family XIII bacterium]|nr:class I SAM-dependent methyltransferase [Clostridiales Family XIII bacterium]